MFRTDSRSTFSATKGLPHLRLYFLLPPPGNLSALATCSKFLSILSFSQRTLIWLYSCQNLKLSSLGQHKNTVYSETATYSGSEKSKAGLFLRIKVKRTTGTLKPISVNCALMPDCVTAFTVLHPFAQNCNNKNSWPAQQFRNIITGLCRPKHHLDFQAYRFISLELGTNASSRWNYHTPPHFTTIRTTPTPESIQQNNNFYACNFMHDMRNIHLIWTGTPVGLLWLRSEG